jgi:hypothetical protein
MTKHPEVFVQLTGEDGNAFRILGATEKALRKGGVPEKDVKEYMTDARSGDYDNLLRVTMDWVDFD